MARAGILALVSAPFSLLTGCLTVPTPKPVEVVVTRTDTGEPAANVPVKVYYLSMLTPRPKDVEGTTDANGRVTLPMSSSGPYITAGATRFYAEPVLLRTGGVVTYKPTAHPEEPIPTYSVRLLPNQR